MLLLGRGGGGGGGGGGGNGVARIVGGTVRHTIGKFICSCQHIVDLIGQATARNCGIKELNCHFLNVMLDDS